MSSTHRLVSVGCAVSPCVRTLIEYTLVSLDGVFADEAIGRFVEYRDEAYLRDGLGQLLACDAMLRGRTTYEGF
jgi:hypothetical protein